MTRGIIYYNRGQKMLVRLAVSLHSLRKLYNGPITLMVQGDDCAAVCQRICADYDVRYLPVTYRTKDTKGATFINATLTHEKTPYDTTLWIDSDTLILADLWTDFFEAAERYEFAIAQISDWTCTGKIAKRLKHWECLYPETVRMALERPWTPAINCGVFAFTKKSAVMADWYNTSSPALRSNITLRYPDEVCCQMMLSSGMYEHIVLDQKYNMHCRAGKWHEHVKLIHYCGNKHCRMNEEKGPMYHAEKWYRVFDEVRERDYVRESIEHDRQLRNNLPLWEKLND